MSTVVINDGQSSAIVVKERVNAVTVTGVVGGGGDANFVFEQNSPSAQWVINHNLYKFPSVTVVDSANNVVYGEVVYDSETQITLTFAGPFSGKAYLN
jgi:hypothetical protein